MESIGMDWEESLELLVERMGDADRLFPSRMHDFVGDLMTDVKDRLWPTWAVEAYEELDARRFLIAESDILNGGDAMGRLSADGREYLRALRRGTAA
jgi:hypothetical protein